MQTSNKMAVAPVGKLIWQMSITARPIRHNAQVPDRNGKIFYTSITSLSHISKVLGDISMSAATSRFEK